MTVKFLKSISTLIVTSSFFFGCSKSNDEKIGCTFQITPVFLDFNVVGAASGKDLFFSADPTYQIKDIYFFKVKDTAKKDTIRPSVEGTGTERIFKISPDNKLLADTLMMHIGETPVDKLVVKMKNSDGPCSNPILGEVFLNDVKLNYDQGKVRIVK
ncbi:hypothetical protein [Sphingobacterium multivorum]|uniref:Lipoprotein n=2 Tax=Bacteroidota TaxID=976 RepID=A0A2X2LZQ6_SPHMU|nr:hypothetical protein [Sphingobacterium multivorum]AZB25156.1 hypothetical protein EG339_11490 [Chryseobacterium bernardetii]QRQ63249.1 hypothetical protein I6J33_09885 [Sphingobacterium multivorum]SPZ95090.1 Uncharacterised protein [Sphingobacterium multivorum]